MNDSENLEVAENKDEVVQEQQIEVSEEEESSSESDVGQVSTQEEQKPEETCEEKEADSETKTEKKSKKSKSTKKESAKVEESGNAKDEQSNIFSVKSNYKPIIKKPKDNGKKKVDGDKTTFELETKEKRNGDYYKFNKSESTLFKFDNNGFTKAVLYRRLRVGVCFKENFDDANNDPSDIIENILKTIRDLAKLYKKNDVTYQEDEYENIEIYQDKNFNICYIYIPYMECTSKIISFFTQQINSLKKSYIDSNVGVCINTNISNIVRLHVCKENGDPNAFVKGFAISSFDNGMRYDQKTGEQTQGRSYVNLQSNFLIASQLGIPKSDIRQINNAMMNVNKISLFNENTDENNYNPEITLNVQFRSKFALVSYEIVGITENKTFKVERTSSLIRVVTKKNEAGVVIPYAISVERNIDSIEVRHFNEIYLDDHQKNIVAELAGFNYDTPVFNAFVSDNETFDDVIFSTFVPNQE